MWLLVLCNVISEISSIENYEKPQMLSLCQRIIRKQHALISNLFSTTVQYWPFFPLRLRLPQRSVITWVLFMPIQVILTLPTLRVMSANVCQGAFFQSQGKWYLHQLGFSAAVATAQPSGAPTPSFFAEALVMASTPPKHSEQSCVFCCSEETPYILALSYTCALNIHQHWGHTVF